MKKIGVIGCGLRATGILGVLMELEEPVEIVAVADPNQENATKNLKDASLYSESIHFYKDTPSMLQQETLDGVIIGTRCSLHTKLAIMVLEKGIPLFLEKPVATTWEDLERLEKAEVTYDTPVVVSFPLRVTPVAVHAKELIQAGRIGEVGQIQAVNNVTYGDIYYQNWYRDEQETGGLFLQKATHDLDYITAIFGHRPTQIAAMKSKVFFKGNKPAGLRCEDCEEYRSCPQSPFVKRQLFSDPSMGNQCSFGVDTGNQDSGSVLVMYDNGVHLSYTQNFFARKQAGRRGARFIGYKGTLEFDWYGDFLKVYDHQRDIVETHQLNSANMSHGGGDAVLMRNFVRIMEGREESKAPLSAGILSARMCLAAKDSAQTGSFVTL